MREIRLFFLLSGLALFPSCSSLMKLKYFAPVQDAGQVDKRESFDHSISLSGPPIGRSFNVGRGKILVRMDSDSLYRHSKVVSFGPPWLPIIPTVLNWFSSIEEIEVFRVQVSLAHQETMTWRPQEAFVSLPNQEKVHPGWMRLDVRLNEKDSDQRKEEFSPEAVIYTFSIPKETDRFSLTLTGFAQEGQSLPEVDIPFIKAKGWVLNLIP